jgi:hypothetical protein
VFIQKKLEKAENPLKSRQNQKKSKNMESLLVYFFGGMKIVFSLTILLGWIFAWRFKKKGGGNLLWFIYGICVIIAALLILFPPDLFGRNDAVREWFMSDQGFIASLNGGRGLSFPAAQTISLTNGIQIMGMVFCITALLFWKIRIKKISNQDKS